MESNDQHVKRQMKDLFQYTNKTAFLFPPLKLYDSNLCNKKINRIDVNKCLNEYYKY